MYGFIVGAFDAMYRGYLDIVPALVNCALLSSLLALKLPILIDALLHCSFQMTPTFRIAVDKIKLIKARAEATFDTSKARETVFAHLVFIVTQLKAGTDICRSVRSFLNLRRVLKLLQLPQHSATTLVRRNACAF